MTLLKDNNYKDINVALLSLEADIKNKITGFDTSAIDKQLAEINSRIDKINAGGGNNSSDEIEDINSKLNSNSIKIRNIEQNIEDIGTQINGIEQKLSDIFSAESKVTDFNATTNSGIYYWVTDAANKPGTDYGVLLVNKYDGGDSASIWVNQIAYGTNNKIYFRQNINSGNWTEWKTIAYLDDIEKTTTKSASLSTVTTETTKYIKLGTFHWYDSFSFKCRIAGNSFEDNVNVNILSGSTYITSVCGYYSTNSARTRSIIVKRGDAWYSDFEIYLKIAQVTTDEVYVTIDKDYQDRINISESTTAPTGTLEEIAFNNHNGMFSSNIEAHNIKANGNITLGNSTGAGTGGYGSEPLTIGFPSGTGDGQSLGFDRNSMQVRTNGSASTMYLNYYGGMVRVNEMDRSDGGLKVKQKMVIPIGAPSSLEDGCIWIER